MTPKQKQTLDYLRAYIGEHGYAPNYNEIMEATGVKSKASVHRFIEGLIARDLLIRWPGRQRGLALPESDDRAVDLLRQVHASVNIDGRALFRSDNLAARISGYLERHGAIQ